MNMAAMQTGDSRIQPRNYTTTGGGYTDSNGNFVHYQNHRDEDGNPGHGNISAPGYDINWRDNFADEHEYQYGCQPEDVLRAVNIRLGFMEEAPESADDRRAEALGLIEKGISLLKEISSDSE